MRRQALNRGQRLSPSARQIIKLRKRASQSGGASLELQIPTNYIRDISRDLNYDITSDASLIMTPNTIGEGRLFNCKPELRNLLTRSEEFDNALWQKTQSSVTSNVISNPINGNTDADKLVENTATSDHRVRYLINQLGIYTFSVYLKDAGRSWCSLKILGAPNAFCNFDLINGVTGLNGGILSSSITNVGSGWFRCSITLNAVSNTDVAIYTLPSDSTAIYTGNGTSGIYLWGAQLEQSSTATAYQRTTDGITDFQATRATTATVIQKDGSIGESCYNLLQQSETFTNAYWTKENVTVDANTITAPNGLLTATKITVNAAALGRVYNNFFNSSSSPVTYTFSIYVKNYTGNIQLTNFASDTGGTQTNITTSTEWQRVSVTASLTGGCRFQIRLNSTIGVSGEIWGAQLLIGTTPKDYLKTTNRLAVPSIDYGLGSNLPALLVEPQRTNLVQWSDDFSNAVWSKYQSSVASNSSYILKSFDLTENTATDIHYLGGTTISISSGQTYTASYYVRKADHRWIQLGTQTTAFGGNNWVNFDFDTGTFGNNGGTGSWTARLLANGYWVLTLTGTAIATLSQTACFIFGTNNTNSATKQLSYTGTNTKICNIAVIQFELGSNATSYIPTTTATATRNNYTSFIDLKNDNLLNKDNFTLYIEGYLYNRNAAQLSVGLGIDSGGGVSADCIGFYEGITGIYRTSNIQTIVGTALANDSYYKLVIQRNGTTVKYFRNGVQLGTTQTIPVFDYPYLTVASGNSTYGIQKIALWKHTKSDAECITLTT